MGVRYRLSALESPYLLDNTEAKIGFLTVFIASAFVATLVALALNNAVTPAFSDPQVVWIPFVIFAPILEEVAKTLCILFVLYAFFSQTIPNRRYGAALGAIAGLGLGVTESISYLQGLAGGEALLRLLVTPMMHPFWSAFVGVGVFVFAARKRSGKNFVDALLGLPIIFFLIGTLSHMVWNGLAVGLVFATGNPYIGIALDILTVFPLSLIILRDFLGGHFNFLNYFETLPEPFLTRAYLPGRPAPPQVATVLSSSARLICLGCGTVNNPIARFCRKCGRRLP